MKIYTYYQDINFSAQRELIDLWKISWEVHGYQPIVLNLEDAKKHPYYDTLRTKIKEFAIKLGNYKINNYGMSCWLRWLAYSTQPNEKFYVSDYDAININFPITEPNDKLHLMDFACPFLASGTPKQFENLCKAFVEVSNERLEILKTQTNYRHDQEFFQYNLMPQHNNSAEDLRNEHDILMTKNRHEIGGYIDPVENKIFASPNIGYIENEKYGVVHASHKNITTLQKKYAQYKNKDASKLRIDIIKNLLEA